MQQRSPKKNAAAEDCRGIRRSKRNYTKLLDDVNRFLDAVVRLVDVLESSLLETLSEGVVFFQSDIAVGFVHELEYSVETAAPVETNVNRSMIIDILAVIDGSLIDLVQPSGAVPQ